MQLATTQTPLTSVVKLRLNNGTSPSGNALTKTMSLFTASLQKTALDTAGLDAAMTVADLLSACLALTTTRVEYQPIIELTLNN